jgi:long-chain acyl-CoA synthetase
MNLPSAFAAAAVRHPDKPALYHGQDEFTYRQLHDQTAWLAHRLADDFEVRPGDRVGVWLKNCPQFVPALFGSLQAGAVVAPINNFLKPDEVHYILQDADVRVLITDGAQPEALEQLQSLRPTLRIFRIEEIPDRPERIAAPPCIRSESDLAILIYTSGTTGRPKGAMLSHGNLLHNVESCRKVLEAADMDRFVVLLPMFHSFMLTVCVLLPLIIGGSLVVIKSLHPPKNIVQEIVARRATILPAVPQFFRTLTQATLPPDLPLRLCISGGAPLPGEILKEFTTKYPFPLLEGYGLSEASPVVSFNPIQGPWKSGSIGVPVHDVEVSIQDDSGNLLPPQQTGEVCVRGGNVMQGYWNQPEETAKVLRNGWLLTGDIGHRDEDGYFFITDRKKDMLLVNGINVYPREIEEVIYRFPGIREAAVIGKPDPRKGEQPLAFVAVNEGAAVDEKALLQFVREHLADYKVPRRAIVLPSLPRNATGKILKTALRDLPT